MLNKLTPFLALFAFLSSTGHAALMQITTPDAAYTGSTTKIDITGLTNFVDYNSISDGSLTITFSSAMNKRVAPGGGWATWGSPPDTEPTPTPVLYSNGRVEMTFSFSSAVNVFGVEIEPNSLDMLYDFTMEFFDGMASLGTITRTGVSGNAGARLLAASSDQLFDSVRISSRDDWAVGNFRYADTVPEPASLALMGLGLAGLAATRRRKVA